VERRFFAHSRNENPDRRLCCLFSDFSDVTFNNANFSYSDLWYAKLNIDEIKKANRLLHTKFLLEDYNDYLLLTNIIHLCHVSYLATMFDLTQQVSPLRFQTRYEYYPVIFHKHGENLQIQVSL